jgi:hypothetical protein
VNVPPVDILHRPVAALVRSYGTPASVATRDDGQHFVFSDGTASMTALVDDDANVHAVDVALAPGTAYPIVVDGTPHRFVFGTTTSIAARDELAADAETEGANFRVFRLGDNQDFVLVFDPQSSTLTHVVLGDRGALLRLGYLTDPRPQQLQFPYLAPKLRGTAIPDGTGPKATVVRLDLNRGGGVTNVTVIVPSDDPAYDTMLVQKLAHDVYIPAKLSNRAIGASVYREIRH